MVSMRAITLAILLQACGYNAFLTVVMPRMSVASTKPQQSTVSAAVLKQNLVDLCSGTKLGVYATPSQKEEIEDVARRLTTMNPTSSPAKSPLIRGRWEMLYSTVPGPSSGKIGPFVGRVYQDIQPEQKRIRNLLELGPEWALRGCLEADVEVISDDTWAIKFDFVAQTLAGKEVVRKKFPADFSRRLWIMRYMDKDFRILYGGVEGDMNSEEKEYIFILRRDSKEPSQ